VKAKKSNLWGSNFIDLARSKGYIIKKPTSAEFKRFINFLLVGKGKNGAPQTVKVSLKPLKKKNSKSSNQKWVWIEIKTSDGKPGWLYGDSDFVVFELSKEFLFVYRKTLLDYINSSVDFNSPFVQNSWEGKYSIFQRKGKLDQITQIKVDNLKNLKNSYTWSYE
tara:strand:+ start:2629 stop:3123 length:495 start_codon:yes stop_codon:yes gene_type:complete